MIAHGLGDGLVALNMNLLKTRAVSMGRCNTGLEFTSGSFKG